MTQKFLNKILRPKKSLDDYFQFAQSWGFSGVELRNDLANKDPFMGYRPLQVAHMAQEKELSLLSINALQRFNDSHLLERNREEAKRLIESCFKAGIPFLVLCPVNDYQDSRSDAQKVDDTQSSLEKLGSLFDDSGVSGLIEPLGFPQSSLRSFPLAQSLILDSSSQNFKLLFDTFHYFLGTESSDTLSRLDPRLIGLIHVSGVHRKNSSTQPYGDEDRILVDQQDQIANKKQLSILHSSGYRGPLSLESFSPKLQEISDEELGIMLSKSLKEICRYIGEDSASP